jgi:histidinol-phosphate aminotransferase
MLKNTIKNLSQSHGYEGGISARQAAKIYNIKVKNFVNLQSNENLFISKSYLKSILKSAVLATDPRLYPKDELDKLEEAIASYVGVKTENIVLGSGADQLIDLLISLVGVSGSIAYSIPTYSYYGISASIRGIKVIEVPYKDDFSLNTNALINKNPDIIFICTPNNPTGHYISAEQLKEVLDRTNGLVVVDETYAEFLGTSFIQLIGKYDNLLILRTLSKSFGLAGLRVGYLVSNAELSTNLKKAQLPFVVSSLAAEVAVTLFQKIPYFKSKWAEAQITMKKFLDQVDPHVERTPTSTYFVTISSCKSNEQIFLELLKYGYITRIIKPFMNYKNPIRLSVAPWKMISNLPSLINELSKC